MGSTVVVGVAMAAAAAAAKTLQTSNLAADGLEIFVRQNDTQRVQPTRKLLKAQFTVAIQIKFPECIFELLCPRFDCAMESLPLTLLLDVQCVRALAGGASLLATDFAGDRVHSIVGVV